MPKKAVIIEPISEPVEPPKKVKRTNKRNVNDNALVEEELTDKTDANASDNANTDKILNPATGKYVSRTGKIGLKLMYSQMFEP